MYTAGKAADLLAESASGSPEDFDSAVSREASGGALAVDVGRSQQHLHAVIARL